MQKISQWTEKQYIVNRFWAPILHIVIFHPEGRLDGAGTLTWENGDYFQGNFSHGIRYHS
jgi:hypothetical protein